MRRVVLLPGLDGTGALFAGLVRAAGPGARLEPIALPPEPLGYAALTAVLGPMLRLTRDTVLVAESFSGPLAAMLAATYPVAALILSNSFVVPPRAAALGLVARAPLFRFPPPAWAVRQFLVGREAPDDLVGAVRAAVMAQPAGTLAARMRAVLTADAGEALARCRAPVTYLRGTADRLVPETSVAAVMRAAPGRVTVIRLGGPHFLLQAAPEASWEVIEDVAERAPAT
jgi:pimeloyl-[acyl-carrier protein] methyl ester esterase